MKSRFFRRAVGTLSILALVASLPLFAGAQVSGVTDGDDVRGLMDIKRVEGKGTKRVKFLISTFPKWTAKRVWDRGFGIVHIDAKGDEWFEFYALIRSDGGQMTGRLYRDRKKKPDYLVARLSAWKPNKKSVIVKVPIGKLNMPESRLFLRWYSKTLMSGSHCQTVCIDRAPNGGSVEHLLVDVEPTPSPTPTPTASPTPTATPSP